MEVWKTIPGWENYEVSNIGRVRSKNRIEGWRGTTRVRAGRILKQRVILVYPSVGLKMKPRTQTALVHRLVAITFIENPNNLPVVNHKDCDPLNYHVDNLEWTTQKENIAHTVSLGRNVKGETHGCSKFTEDQVRLIRQSKEGSVSLAKHFGVDRHTISRIRSRKMWKHVA